MVRVEQSSRLLTAGVSARRSSDHNSARAEWDDCPEACSNSSVVLCPNVMRLVADAIGRGDETDFFDTAAHRVGDAGEDGAPGQVRVFKISEFCQEDVRGIAANGVGPARHGDDAAAAGEGDGGSILTDFRCRSPRAPRKLFSLHGHFESLAAQSFHFCRGIRGIAVRKARR